MTMHKNSILDLIIYLARQLSLGQSITDIKQDGLKGYNYAQVSAAYSWIMQKHPTVTEKTSHHNIKSHRVLHFAERMLISAPAYGYLLEMVNIGLLDNKSMENIIERIMFHSTEPIDLAKMKQMVENYLLENDSMFKNHTSMLRGNETVN